MSKDRQARFSDRYASGETPWDSGVTPPEIMELLAALGAFDALDLGCGTGTVMRDLLRRGWRVDGVDFVGRAIELAAAKLRDFPDDRCRLFQHDVTRLRDLPELRSGYRLVIDIGCGHTLGEAAMTGYASAISQQLEAGGFFMLYAGHPRPESTVGWDPRPVAEAFGSRLDLLWEQRGEDRAIGAAASWYKMRKPK